MGVAMASVRSVAVQQVSSEAWENCSDSALDKDWYMDFSGPYRNDTSQPFTIRPGGYDSERDGAYDSDHGLFHWCLNAGGVDSDPSLVNLWECNGSPEQKFMLSPKYNITNLTEA